jgi:hypothetical protein
MKSDSRRRVAKILESADQTHRVLIVARHDGTFAFVVQKWYRNVYEGRVVAEGWTSLPASNSIYETIETAEREARAQFRWLFEAQ